MSSGSDITVNKELIGSLFSEYLLLQHKSDIHKVLLSSTEPHQSVVVHFNYLCEFNSIFSELILLKPDETITLLDKSLYAVICSWKSETSIDPENSPKVSNVHVRLTALPIIPEVHRNHIPTSADIGKFIALRAIVSRVGPVQVVEGEAKYRCSNCNLTIVVTAKFENQYNIKPPKYCPNRREACRSMSFVRLYDNNLCAKNYQEIYVHEHFGSLNVGVMRRAICVCIEDDLLETVKPGDDVVINGIVSRRWLCMKEGLPCAVSVFFKANYIENLSEIKAVGGLRHISSVRIIEFEKFWFNCQNWCSSLEARNEIIRSIFPSVYGMYLVKLSLALMLAGAPEWVSSTGEFGEEPNDLCLRIRGNPHILLIGDPGTAKSALLRGCTYICDRAVLATATGSTAAGLTAAAIRDKSGWTLDAGALVLADGGVCAIDEFTALHGANRAAVHEAMEQQTISLAKAGVMARLNCRCSVLAAANPPPTTKFADSEDFGLHSPLLSRFDLIWRLVDPLDSTEWDSRIANFVLNFNELSYLPTNATGDARDPGRFWPSDRIKEYFTWIRSNFKPQLSMGAANLLQRYYVWQRKQMSEFLSTGESGRRTLRLMESLVRLTKAHARLMAKSEASVQDAIIVIHLVDSSLCSTASVSGHGVVSICAKSISPELVVSTDVPRDAGHDYHELEKLICTTLDYVSNPGGAVATNTNSDKWLSQNSDFIHDSPGPFSTDPVGNCTNRIQPLLCSTQLVNSQPVTVNKQSTKSLEQTKLFANLSNILPNNKDESNMFNDQQCGIQKPEHLSFGRPLWQQHKLSKCDVDKSARPLTHSQFSVKRRWMEDGAISFGFENDLTSEDFDVDL